jgi:hypothetical protein
MPSRSTDMYLRGGGGELWPSRQVPRPAAAAKLHKGTRPGAWWRAPLRAGFAAEPTPPAANCAMAMAATSL